MDGCHDHGFLSIGKLLSRAMLTSLLLARYHHQMLGYQVDLIIIDGDVFSGRLLHHHPNGYFSNVGEMSSGAGMISSL